MCFHWLLETAEDVDSAVSESAVGAVVLLVLPQVHFVLEAVEAARTAVGSVVPVFTAVGDEVGALAECLPTYLTHMRLLPWQTNTAEVIYRMFKLYRCDTTLHQNKENST